MTRQSGAGLPKQEAALPETASEGDGEIPAGAGGGLPAPEDGLGNGPEPQALITELPTELPTEPPVEEAPAAKEVSVEETVAQDLPVGPQIGYLAPDFSLQTPDGQAIRLSELRGRPVVISYWTSWCGPCKNEMGILQRIYEQHQATGFTVLAVNAIGQDSINDVTEMVSGLGVTYTIVLDEGDQFASSYNALFFPTSYFVDASGVIQDIALGDSPEAEFQARVEGFLAGE